MTQASSRREFLRLAGRFAIAGAATPMALSLAGMAPSAALAAGSDYRALVCIFLYGGNDHHNTIIPFDEATHAQYAAIRTGIVVPRDTLATTELRPLNPWNDGRVAGRRMALNPAMAALVPLFDAQKIAVLMNVGTLVAPVSQYATTPQWDLPPKLFSHNDQQSVWQSGLAEGATSGWGGRLADRLLAGNGSASSFTSISASGNAVFMSGKNSIPYQVSTRGPIAVNTVYGSTTATNALKRIMQRSSTHLLEEEHAVIARRSIASQARISNALADTALPTDGFTELGAMAQAGNGLAGQLRVVAQLIAARNTLGMTRQVFFVSAGGFDLHDGLMQRHPALLGALANAMAAFYRATDTMGVAGQVTTFTGSDFGRTLASNGDGSDHGWGSYQFVMGGAVRGGQWYGQLPLMSLAKADDPVGSGRLVPAMAVDQMGATLGRWFGVPDADLLGSASAGYQDGVFPRLNRFGASDMGFMICVRVYVPEAVNPRRVWHRPG